MMNPLDGLADRWRDVADTLRTWGARDRAAVLSRCADEAADAFGDWWTEPLSIEEAARWSGYSRERLRELVRDGLIPDRRPTGARQGTAYRIRRCDLPRHPAGKRDSDDDDAGPLPGRDPDDGRATPAERAARRTAR